MEDAGPILYTNTCAYVPTAKSASSPHRSKLLGIPHNSIHKQTILITVAIAIVLVDVIGYTLLYTHMLSTHNHVVHILSIHT